MTPSDAIPILQALADGLDPATGQPFPSDSPYQQANVIRALHAALETLRAPVRATGGSPSDSKPRRPPDPSKPAAGRKWTPEEDQRLRDAFTADTPIRDLATAHGRTHGAISARLVKLGLITITSPTAGPQFTTPRHSPPQPASAPTPPPPPAPPDNCPF